LLVLSLDQQEALLRGAKPELFAQATAPFEQALPEAQAAIQQGRGRFESGITEAGAAEQGLLSQARNLANELQLRNRQIFGGAGLSSAAQAAGELLGRETSRSLGDIRRSSAESVEQLRKGSIDFENQAQAQLQKLELQKNQAISSAELDFRDRLSEIDRARGQLAQNKAALKLDALREFRAQVANVNAQESAFRQNIDLMREQARINLNSQLQNINTGVGTATGDIESFLQQLQQQGTGAASNLGVSQDVAQPQGLSGLIGLLLGGRRDEEFGGQIPIGAGTAFGPQQQANPGFA